MSEIVAEKPSSVTEVAWRTVPMAIPKRSAGRSAEEELEQRIRQARDQGFEEGLASGRADVRPLVPGALENISASLAQIELLRRQLREQTGQELVRLALTVAERVIHRETVIDSNAMAGVVRAALSKLQSREVGRVRMHPELEPVVSKALEQCGAPANLVLMVDAHLNPGDLLFEISQGVLDASLSTQLREMERALEDKLAASLAP